MYTNATTTTTDNNNNINTTTNNNSNSSSSSTTTTNNNDNTTLAGAVTPTWAHPRADARARLGADACTDHTGIMYSTSHLIIVTYQCHISYIM